MPAFLTFRKPGTAYLMSYLGHISKLRLDVLLPAYSWAFLCRKELSDCVSEKNRSDFDFLLIWMHELLPSKPKMAKGPTNCVSFTFLVIYLC